MMKRVLPILSFVLAAASLDAMPLREWNWRYPADQYKELEFTDRAGVDRAARLFQQAIDAESAGKPVAEQISRYRAAAGEWRKVQVQGEAGEANPSLLAYAIFMQGYSRQQARDRNEAIRLFNEVLDVYADEKFIAVPSRYMLSVVKRELGDVRKANADLEEIAADGDADGHPIYYNVLRSLAAVRWEANRDAEAIDCWSKIVFSKGKPDYYLFHATRRDLINALIVNCRFGELEAAMFAGYPPEKAAERRTSFGETAKWMSEIDRYGHHWLTQLLDRRYPRDKKASERARQLEKIRKGFLAWIRNEGEVFKGAEDGWAFALACFRASVGVEKPADLRRHAESLTPFVKDAKPDKVDGRARTLALELAALREGDAARRVAELAKSTLARLYLQYEISNQLGEWKPAAQYLGEYAEAQPPPPPDDLKKARYDLAWLLRYRLSEHEKAAKIYQELDDPPRSLWGLAESLRDAGKKDQSYKVLVEITSMFPDSAAEAVLRTAQWKERDGDKEKAIALYKRLLSHPKWKQSRASSEAHQALERFGIATGGAMTNEVR